MALNQRRVKILDLIREDGHAKVQELSRIFNVTDVTIRQDLEALEKLGYIQREHGGAFLKDVGSFAKTGKVFNQTHIEEKREIAQKAASFISEGECIILDSGSTTTGKMAADSLKGFHANKLFLATAGISPDMSLTYPSLSDLMVKSAMIKAAEEVILVADSSKIGISAFASLGSISMVNSFITDSNISEENIEKMKEKNINLLIG